MSMKVRNPTVLRALGISRTERELPLDDLMRTIAGADAGTDETQQRALLRELLRARGHDLLADRIDAADDRKFVVAGAVDRDGRLDGLAVTITAQALGEDPRPIANTKTNAEGEFSVTFEADAPPIIRVMITDGRKRLYVSPPQRAMRETWIEWTPGGAPVARPGAFELRDALLTRSLEKIGRPIESLQESTERAEISVLAESTGLSRSHVAMHALSARLEKDLGIPRQTIFAAVGSSMSSRAFVPPPARTAIVPADGGVGKEFLEQLRRDARAGKLEERAVALGRALVLGFDAEGLRAAVDEAVASGQVSSKVQRDVDKAVATLARARVQAALAERPSGASTWTEVLAAAGVPDGRVEDAAGALLRHPAGDALWTTIAESVDANRRPAVVDTLRMASFVNYDAPLLRALADQKVTSPRALASRTTDELDKVLDTALRNRPDAAAIKDTLVRRIDTDFPGESLIRRRRAKLGAATQRYIEKQGQALDLLKLNIEATARAGGFGRRPQETREARGEMLTLQRMGRLVKDGAIADGLLALGYDSAAKIAFTDRAEFLARARGVATEPRLTQIHRRARTHYRATQSLFLDLNPTANNPNVAVLNTPIALMDQNAIQGAPTWEFLFGSPDYCDCEQCSSVTSPSAYLVDLLLWLQRAPGGAPRPADVLLGRRPDLVKILLNCANTNTLVPYIDLVCELLEEAVAIREDLRLHPGAPQITQAMLDQARRARQTTLTAAEIRAYPEHLDEGVYVNTLSQFVDAMVPPFDLPAAEVRAYLASRSLTRLELMMLFDSGSAVERAAERLAIAPAERTVIAPAASAATQAVQLAQWGFAGPTVPLEQYMRRAPSPRRPDEHLTYDELLALLRCPFANPQWNDPANTVAIELEPGVPADVCRASDRQIIRLTLNVLDRQHRFLRLARHVPWTLPQLDLLIAAVGNGQIADASLAGLGDALILADRTGLSPDEVAYLFRDFDAAQAAADARFDGRPTLYARLFLARTEAGGPPAAFRDPGANPTALTAEVARISGALNLSEPELTTLMSRTGLTGANISFAALSTLYRHARLAASLGLGIADFEALVARVGNPFASPADALRLARARDVVANTPMVGAPLAVLSGAAPVVVPDAAPLVASLAELFAATEAQLALATGAAPARADVLQAIVAAGSWSEPVTSWLGIDSRFGALAIAFDRRLGAGQVVAGLYANPQTAATLAALARLSLLVSSLSPNPDQVATLAALPGVLDVIEQPTWANLENAVRFMALLKGADSVEALSSYIADTANGGVTRATLAQRLAIALDLEAGAIEDAWDALFGVGALDRAQLRSGAHYQVLRRAIALAEELGVTPEVLKSWAAPWPTSATAVGVRNAVRSRMSTADWLKASTTVQNELREKRRDALVRYLLATAGPNDAATAADLYGHFLIDVQMDDCMNTSRIVQANAAIQLFVQRCFLGLEDIARDQLGTDHWKQWEWRQRYRLWEANRMVFLYPENFLNVALRSNASPLFRDFMKEVRQGDGTDESVRDAIDGYLGGLEQIANLDHAAIATNMGEAGATRELHVISRSRGTPQKHYHRKLSGGIWTPYEEVAVGTPGRHLALTYRKGTTSLVWPTFTDHLDTRQQIPAATEGPATEAPPPSGISYLSYGWVARDRKRWTDIQTSERALLHRKRGRRAFLTTFGTAADALDLNVFAPEAPSSAADSAVPATTPYLGVMRLERDIVSVTVNHSRRQLDGWLGGDHQVHIDATATLAPVIISFLDWCTCQIFFDTSVQAWPGLLFDENRMLSGLTNTRLRVPLDTATPMNFQLQTVLNGSPLSVAFDVSHLRVVLSQTLMQSAAHGSICYLGTNTIQGPSPDAFTVTDSQRSFLCLSPNALAEIAPAVDAPSAARLLVLPAYHPYASELRMLVRRYNDGLERLFTPWTQETPATLGRAPLTFAQAYGDFSPEVVYPSAAEGLEFDAESPYALYNWEVFLHAPLFVAEQLRSSLRYEDARRWYQFIFTPFTSEPVDPARPTARYWVPKPFREAQGLTTDVRDIITQGAIDQINPYVDIEEHPFDAQRVAQARPSAYQKHVMMRYLDNVIAWGDSLYRRAQREDVYEAIQHYVIAQSLLGPRPEKLRPLGVRRDLAFEDAQWAGGANALVELENLIADAGEAPEESEEAPLVELPLVPGLYFCVPPNQRLLGYWDTVERRLSNLRHCLTIDGRPVEYDLLAAPIDPQALVDAAAAGLSVAEALALAGNQLPPYRFRIMLAKAQEACADVKALGGALLSALEKRDAENVALLRSAWEGKILEKTQRTRALQRDQAQAEVETLQEARRTIEARRDFYASRERLNDLEKAALGLTVAAAALDTTGFVFDVLGGVLYLIPNINLGVSGFGGTPQAGAQIGGDNIGSSVGKTGQGLSRLAGLLDRASGMVATQAGYERRQNDWDFQAQQARLDLNHMDRQIAAARLRVAISDAEIRGHAVQQQSWEAIDAQLQEKFSNEERYAWMVESLRNVYQEAYQDALKMAKVARECLAFELPPGTAVPPIGQAYWESLAHGLMAGERLSGDLRELDMLFATQHTHEHIVTQHVALSHVAPQALLALRRTGQCAFRIPRWWFQRFNPGLANRRVKSIAVSVPGVLGPYVAMNATLALAGSHRTLSSISLSSGMNDAGFDVTVAPEMYLPFEGLSLEAETSWTFGFPPDPAAANQVITDVDYATISDVILHVQYTADAGQAALDGPPELLSFIDVRQMDADAWSQLVAGAAHQCRLVIRDLVPRFLSGYTVDSLVDTVALLQDGTAVTGSLTIALGTGAAAGTVTIGLAQNQAIDWDQLSKVYIVVKLT